MVSKGLTEGAAKTMTTATDLIARSVSHTEIVTAAYDAEIAAALEAACEDSVEANDDVTEYWGTTEAGDEWRVHLTGARA